MAHLQFIDFTTPFLMHYVLQDSPVIYVISNTTSATRIHVWMVDNALIILEDSHVNVLRDIKANDAT